MYHFLLSSTKLVLSTSDRILPGAAFVICSAWCSFLDRWLCALAATCDDSYQVFSKLDTAHNSVCVIEAVCYACT